MKSLFCLFVFCVRVFVFQPVGKHCSRRRLCLKFSETQKSKNTNSEIEEKIDSVDGPLRSLVIIHHTLSFVHVHH